MAQRKDTKGKRPQKHLSESSPNPHGENNVLQMPIHPDQRNATGGRNVPQVPNTVGGRLNPSVVHEFKQRVPDEEAKGQGKGTRRKKDA